MMYTWHEMYVSFLHPLSPIAHPLSHPSCPPSGNFFFRQPTAAQHDEKVEDFVEYDEEAKEPEWDEKILCRECHQVITSPCERIDVQGSHQHTFANPTGLLFQIGCFRTVKGCGYAGPPTPEWSWFKGYSWRIAVCSKCLTHLGWMYLASGSESFHGLILNRLVQAS